MPERLEIPLEPAIVTIIGITGDLSNRKLLPALYHLAYNQMLPEDFKIVGTSRRTLSKQAVIDQIEIQLEKDNVKPEAQTLQLLLRSLDIVKLDVLEPTSYVALKEHLDSLEDEVGRCMNRLFYLAIPANVFAPIVKQLGRSGLNTGCQHGHTESRLLIEKPFGYDLTSAHELVATLKGSFHEKDIYRIDHYLAKETVQNIVTFRFSNPIFVGMWNRQHIKHVIITAAESIGIEGRANFYESTGALRDIIQSHLLQVLALVTMERPKENSAESIHAARKAALEAIRPPKGDEMAHGTIRGQYKTYRDEVVEARSMTETYAAIRLSIDNARWKNVPMYLRTGKKLAEKVTEVTVVFYDETTPGRDNYLTLRIQPDESIMIDLQIKKPGFNFKTEDVLMDFKYHQAIDPKHPDAYERVLVDTLRGDKTLFATSDQVIASWKIIQPILDAWQADEVPLLPYENNSWGPRRAEEMVTWYKPSPQ